MVPLTWSNWIDLDADLATYRQHVAAMAGFYRIRVKQQESLAYIGQTGRSLRLRTRGELARNALRPIEQPPWNDPHTAASLLWAYRHEDNFQFEVSVAPCELPTQLRQCREDSLLYLHRIEYGHSTLCNHGRRHPLWTRASNRKNARPTNRLDEAIDFSSLPVAIGETDPMSENWLGLDWSKFEPLPLRAPTYAGVYRIANTTGLVYLGESNRLSSRLASHAKDGRFKSCSVSFSLMEGALPWHLKERETDLIGAYFLETNQAPMYQYNPVAQSNHSSVSSNFG